MKTNNGGFTLLEVIISVAALSAISVFVMRMFLASSNLNDKAMASDIALSIAVSHIENIKASKSLTEYLSEFAPEYETVSGNGFTHSFYFDEAWESLGSDTIGEAKYLLEMYVTPETPANGNYPEAGSIYIIRADISDVSEDAEGTELVSLKAKEYFPEIN